MAEVDTENKVISKRNEGFPEWLDFEKLRKEGIDYLGELSGKIWTDHNVHDPGITILEMLCYALLDLGYRTSLPSKDLFAKNPADKGNDNNFFTPSQILGCNPLTISDYRRLLVDIPDVKNAWLTVAEDITIGNICKREEFSYRSIITGQQNNCINFLNGLYHVYLDLENDLTEEKKKETVSNVKKVLMAHRNLCEDFYNVTILCKQKIGVCADIEIESSADAEKIFLEIIEKLRDFISPSPKFYRLKQLLEEKRRSIEQIFAGRPFNLSESHGFVDAEEFENLILRKEIHLSDVYDVIFNINGISAIRNLNLQNCDGSRCLDRNTSPWIFKIFENHVPDFNLDCSGFHFTRNGTDIQIDKGKYKEYLKLNFSNSGKTIGRSTFADLDLPVPSGNYREDIAEYYPLENDFPKVYGIAEGSLPDNVPATRKAKSLQLKGYLLFFDHLLSGYLCQLKNIRNLFSLNGDAGEQQHTYFINKLINWPGLEKLLRFDSIENTTGSFGNTLAFPVSKKKLEEIISTGKIIDCDFEKDLKPFLFCSAAERDIAINQLMEDILYGTDSANVVITKKDCWFFYSFTSSEDFAIIGRGEYKTEKSARTSLEKIRFLAGNKKSYRSYYDSDAQKFSFNIGAGISGYWSYLQSIAEDEKLYLERKKIFLDHLLARFSETFTDYALISYSFLKDEELIKNNIRNKQKFLTSYPELSSTRGKAYDYGLNGWNNNNVSGFEKKTEAYAGIGEGRQENLCHFEIVEYEEQSEVNLAWKDYSLFRSEHSFDNREEGKAAVHILLKQLQDKKNYFPSYSSLDNNYVIQVNAAGAFFKYSQQFASAEDTANAISRLHRLFSSVPVEDDIYPSQYQHLITLTKKSDGTKWVCNRPVINSESVLKTDVKILSDFADKKIWVSLSEEAKQDDLTFMANPGKEGELINLKAFDPDVNRVDVKNKSIIYQFTVNDLQKNFFFISEQGFEGKPAANENLIPFLFLLTDKANYIVEEKSKEEYYIKVEKDGKLVATNTVEHNSREGALNNITSITEYVNNQIYILRPESKPFQWRYNIRFGLPGTSEVIFSANKEYHSYKDAANAAALITDPYGSYEISANKNIELEIKDAKHPRTITATYKMDISANPEELKNLAKAMLVLKKTIGKINLESNASEMESMVVPDRISRQGNFGYRLVKKDDYHAWYRLDGDFSNKIEKEQKIKEVYKIFHSNYNFLEICYGGDNIIERKDNVTGISWYHFQVKSRLHEYSQGNELVLFESIRGYTSADEAQKIFTEEYTAILTTASDENNYGLQISFEKKIIHDTNSLNQQNEIVFIPETTMKQYGYNRQQAAKELAALAASYPVKSIKKTDPEFAKYFLCKPEPEKPGKHVNCTKETEKEVYYFVFPVRQSKISSWVSCQYFNTSQEALKQFYFFLILLKYKGNYHITYNECDCSWRLYLREILAVSLNRFINEAVAWGKEGIEKFICVSQSRNAFTGFLEERGCCYTFNVACGNTGLIHPCGYDTSEKRNQALAKLIRASRKMDEDIKSGYNIQYWEKMLKEWYEVSGKKGDRTFQCNDLIESVEMIHRHEDVIANMTEFKKFAYYFPIKRKKIGASNTVVYKYFLEIKLAEFCDDDLDNPKPCGCSNEENNEPCSCCCTAWISECCFDTCEDAMRYFYKVAGSLADSRNYYRVFDCDCGPYGIRFFCNCEHDEQEKDATGAYINEKRARDCCNEIIAYNPQCYTSSKMVCDAVQRSRNYINAEGMHVVEHILLRPHCTDGDCNCVINPCDEITQCNDFKWPLSDDDPCEKNKSYCFVPGTDPYSFIATIALPAWPERFRKKETRQLIEQLLYREVPAHIMLRILWLAPKDLCKFESVYHNWTRWLADKTVCGDHNPPCELINFLFEYQHECFECEDCIPCAEIANPPDPCTSVTQREKDSNEYVNEINKLYCWPLICPKDRQQYNRQYNLPEKQERIKKQKLEAIEKKLQIAESADSIEAERKIDQRIYMYRTQAKAIAENSENINAALVFSFLNDVAPEFQHYREVVEALIANKKSSPDMKVLNTDQKSSLIQLATWYYLDKAVLDKKINEHKSDIKELFRKLESKDLLPGYKNWNGIELLAIKPETSLNDIKKLFK